MGCGIWDDLTGKSAAKKSAKAMEKGADKSAEVQREAIAENKRQFDIARSDSLKMYKESRQDLQPWRTAGQQSLGKFQRMLDGDMPSLPTMDKLDMYMDPGYQFRLQQGLGAVENSAAARGMQLSGNTIKGLTDYAQGAASQEFGAARQRQLQDYEMEMNQWNTRLGGYGTLAGLGTQGTLGGVSAGQSTSGTMAGLTSNQASLNTSLAQGIGQSYMDMGAAQAAGYMGAYNTMWNGIQGLAQGGMNMATLAMM